MFVNGEADAKLVAKGHTVVVHGIGGWESEEVEDLLHVLVLGIFEDAISFRMKVVPGLDCLGVDEGYDWELDC